MLKVAKTLLSWFMYADLRDWINRACCWNAGSIEHSTGWVGGWVMGPA
jgi:hypothetical protein